MQSTAQPVSVEASPEADEHPEDLCLAVVTALALALAGVALRHWLVVAGNRRLAIFPSLRLPSRPPSIPPSLSKLCVLRT